ncbi:uncharacterized protein LOC116427065 [Nomia melanderi]|uniref:uncharacterized protein LOC116427065 n=1 Tax=Nomia melanderi TaxID=2448451 RepID=UPI00130437AA|nr:uncharacterized protein LOC116427065 [Nomia melanderi]
MIGLSGRRMLPRSRKVQSVPCFGSVEFVTCLWIACAICSTLLATAEGFHIFTRYGKQHEPRAGSLIWSRYGRSDGPHKLHVSLQKYAEMEPREYRFYLGSRYGKRSSPDYRTVSSVDRFSAALSFMDHVDGVDLDAENDASNGSDPQPLS